MSYNLKDLSFEVIDLGVQGKAELYINATGLTFSKRVAEDMGYPSYIKIMLDKKEKMFAIQACRQDNDKAYKFSKPKTEQKNSISLNSFTLRHIVRGTMPEWDKTMRYKIDAIYFPDEKIMLFDFKTAIEQPLYRADKAFS